MALSSSRGCPLRGLPGAPSPEQMQGRPARLGQPRQGQDNDSRGRPASGFSRGRLARGGVRFEEFSTGPKVS